MYLIASKEHPDLVLPETQQLEIANRFQTSGDRESAASADLQFLEHHSTSRQAPEVRLLLASLLIRSLDRAEEARPLLESALPELHSQQHRDLAQRLLAQISSDGEDAT